ncbi:MAG: hypothetical protein Q8O11_03265, partial [Syntrophales bacterium]|nr:hypothetical protein [Syntrophales bacterium]
PFLPAAQWRDTVDLFERTEMNDPAANCRVLKLKGYSPSASYGGIIKLKIKKWWMEKEGA